MVIKSPFKDYYDFVGNRYGGGDPRIVYERVRLSPPSARGGQIYETHKKVEVSEFSLPSPADFYRTWDYGWKYQLAGLYLVIAGKRTGGGGTGCGSTGQRLAVSSRA